LADDDDVLGKADALLRRRSVAPPADGSQTGGVPLLTDLVGEPPDASDALTGDVAHEVFDRVIAEVESRLTAELERRVAERLAPEVNSAVVSALADLRPELAKTIADAVAEALAKRPPQ
jgi:hypothetical protein